MKIRVWILVAMGALFLPSPASAVCSAFYPTVADGRVANPYYGVGASSTIAVYAQVTADHSYSVEITDPYDSLGGPGTFFLNFIGGGGDCASNSADTGAIYTDTSLADRSCTVQG